MQVMILDLGRKIDRPGPDDLRYVLNMQKEAREWQAATFHMHDGGPVPQYIPQPHFNTNQGERRSSDYYKQDHHFDKDDEWAENWTVVGAFKVRNGM